MKKLLYCRFGYFRLLTNECAFYHWIFLHGSDLIDARMDAARNKFLLATLCITIASLCLSAISCVSSIFGMNLTNHYETDPTKFVEVTFGSIAGSVVLGILILAGFIMTGVITGIGPVDQDGIDTLF